MKHLSLSFTTQDVPELVQTELARVKSVCEKVYQYYKTNEFKEVQEIRDVLADMRTILDRASSTLDEFKAQYDSLVDKLSDLVTALNGLYEANRLSKEARDWFIREYKLQHFDYIDCVIKRRFPGSVSSRSEF